MGDNADSEKGDAVKVYLRLRPLLDQDCACCDSFVISSECDLTVNVPADFNKSTKNNSDFTHKFTFTNIYDEETTQMFLYQTSVLNSVDQFLKGTNCLVFTYGVTNSGKTFTLIGNNEKPGIIYNALRTIFSSLEESQICSSPEFFPTYHNQVLPASNNDLTNLLEQKSSLLGLKPKKRHSLVKANSSGFVYPSFIEGKNLDTSVLKVDENIPTHYYLYLSIAEIYNEQIFDLLNVKLINKLQAAVKRSPLSIGEDIMGYCYIKGLTHILIESFEDAVNILNCGAVQRKVASTRLNMKSSRSHVIYSIKLIKVHSLPNDSVTSCSELCFVDLAGSERQSKALSVGTRLKEASNINLSLLVLGKCIEVIRRNRDANESSSLVPFRESKLTRLLQPFFVSNSSINLFVNISSDSTFFDETMNVLRFSSVTKEALSKPMRMDLYQASETDKPPDEYELKMMSKSELIRNIESLKRRVTVLQSEKLNIETKTRRECYIATEQTIKKMNQDHQKYLDESKRILSECYREKMRHLEEYYMELINDKDSYANLSKAENDTKLSELSINFEKSFLSVDNKENSRVNTTFEIEKDVSSLKYATQIAELKEQVAELRMKAGILEEQLRIKEEKLISLSSDIAYKNQKVASLTEILGEKDAELEKAKANIENAVAEHLTNIKRLEADVLDLKNTVNRQERSIKRKTELHKKMKENCTEKEDELRNLRLKVLRLERQERDREKKKEDSTAVSSHSTPKSAQNTSRFKDETASFRLLYEETRDYARKLEDRLHEATAGTINSVPKRKSLKRSKNDSPNQIGEINPSMIFRKNHLSPVTFVKKKTSDANESLKKELSTFAKAKRQLNLH